ncbi:efflux RND transporter periplasmic adaptor subunit [Paenibacillus sp. KS-LC4]|uniref:efflux RND transporter periplasmic adaptor subunit n=1 Tax=Paenibacillus sp. KS-LC4 TaxID=2979727 RepID=UPI0030D0564F
MKRNRMMLVASVIIVGIIIGNIFLLNRTGTSHSEIIHVDTAKAATQTISETLIASGLVIANEKAEIYKDETMGKIKKWHVHEGAQVEKGDLLFEYANDEWLLNMEQLENLQNSLQLTLQGKQENFDEIENEFRKDLEQGIDVETAKKNAEKKISARKREIRFTELEIESNTMKLAALKKNEADFKVVSPVAGTVKINSPSNILEYQSEGPLLRILTSKTPVIKGTLTEFDATSVKAGQLVKIHAKAMPEEEWAGVVEALSYTPIQAGNGQVSAVTSYPFLVSIKEHDKSLPEGFHVSLEIELNAKQNVVVVPFDAVLMENDKEYVYVVEQGTIRKREVEIGLIDDNWEEVVSGIRAGEVIARNPQVAWVEGMEVKLNVIP